jgi:hypothetical protein
LPQHEEVEVENDAALEAAEQAIAALNAKRAKVLERTAKATLTHQAVAYAALVGGDREAKARLDQASWRR